MALCLHHNNRREGNAIHRRTSLLFGADRGILSPVVIVKSARGAGIVVAVVVGGDGGEGDASGCRIHRLLDL